MNIELASLFHFAAELLLAFIIMRLTFNLNKKEDVLKEERERKAREIESERAKRDNEISTLFQKHDHDVEELQNLRVEMARNYHNKAEIAEIIGGIKVIIADMRDDFRSMLEYVKNK